MIRTRILRCERTHDSARFVVALIVASGAILSTPSLVAQPVPDARIRIACVGDSITFGAGVEERETNAWPEQLGRMLGPRFDVRNFGVNGATLLAAGDLPYRHQDAYRRATEYEPHFVIIALGTNDTKPQNWAHEADLERDLDAIVDHFASLSTRPLVFIARPVPVVEDRWGITESRLRESVRPRLAGVARAWGLGVIDFESALAGFPELVPDGVHPNARGARKLADAAARSLGFASAPVSVVEAADRPNFVVIIADDMAADDCGAFGNPHIRTPRIDRLAREGLRFDRAFVTASSCSPSRASLLTGRYPHATGANELHRPLPAGQLTFAEILRAAGYWTAAAGKWHLGSEARTKFDRVYDGGGPSGCEDWVRALDERRPDSPFLLWLASIDPHRDYQEGTAETPHRLEDVIVPPYLPDVEATRRDLAAYYDEIHRLDGFVGRVLDGLDAAGLSSNTVVVFLSDNGRPFPRCKTTLFDSGVRTPLIVRWPRSVAPGVTTSLASTVDIAPTLLELAGVPIPPTLQGTSLVPIFRNPTAEVRDWVFAERDWHDYSAHERLVRSKRWAYIWNGYPWLPGTPPADAVRSPTHRAMTKLRDEGRLAPEQSTPFVTPVPVERLFDTESDPHELRDLALDPRSSSSLRDLREALAIWRLETGDWTPAMPRADEFDRASGEKLLPRTEPESR
jgi:N-sulfoglucosamine sulfohydrolase